MPDAINILSYIKKRAGKFTSFFMKLKIADQNSVPGEPGIATATLPNQIL
jgi:hypothetical protein